MSVSRKYCSKIYSGLIPYSSPILQLWERIGKSIAVSSICSTGRLLKSEFNNWYFICTFFSKFTTNIDLSDTLLSFCSFIKRSKVFFASVLNPFIATPYNPLAGSLKELFWNNYFELEMMVLILFIYDFVYACVIQLF